MPDGLLPPGRRNVKATVPPGPEAILTTPSGQFSRPLADRLVQGERAAPRPRRWPACPSIAARVGDGPGGRARRQGDPHDHRQHRAGLVDRARPAARQRGRGAGRGQRPRQPGGVHPGGGGGGHVGRPGPCGRTKTNTAAAAIAITHTAQATAQRMTPERDRIGAGWRWPGPCCPASGRASLACLVPSASSPAERSCPLQQPGQDGPGHRARGRVGCEAGGHDLAQVIGQRRQVLRPGRRPPHRGEQDGARPGPAGQRRA